MFNFEGFSSTIRNNQIKKVIGSVYEPIVIFEYLKVRGFQTQKFTNKRILNFVIKYLYKNKTFARLLDCSFRAQVESFEQKSCRKSRDTVPLSGAFF